MSSTYAYANLPMTGGIFAALTLELNEPMSVVSRKDLIAQTEAYHIKNGGLPARGSLISVAKKGLQMLQAKGSAEQAQVAGYWRIGQGVSAAASGPQVTEPEMVEFGEGGEIVYAYYFPAYRDQATLHGRPQWPIKIGMTTGEIKPRLQDQIGTAMPEKPLLAMVHRTDQAADIERLIHSTLRARKRKVDGSPGTEWFLTSVSEIREIIEFSGNS